MPCLRRTLAFFFILVAAPSCCSVTMSVTIVCKARLVWLLLMAQLPRFCLRLGEIGWVVPAASLPHSTWVAWLAQKAALRDSP